MYLVNPRGGIVLCASIHLPLGALYRTPKHQLYRLCAAHNHRRRTHGPERTWHIQTCHWPSSCAAMMAHDSLEHLKVPKTWVACCGFLGCDAQQGTRLSACCANPIRYKCKQMRHSTGRPPAGATARSASQPAMPYLHFCGRRQTQRLRHTEYSLHTIP